MSDCELVDGSGWISDESDFYGSQKTRDRLEKKARRPLKMPADTHFSDLMAKKVKPDAEGKAHPTPSMTPGIAAEPIETVSDDETEPAVTKHERHRDLAAPSKSQRAPKRPAETPSSEVTAKKVKLEAQAKAPPTPSPTPKTEAKPTENVLDFLRSRPQIAAMRGEKSKALRNPPKPEAPRTVNGKKTDDLVEVPDRFLGHPNGWQRSETIPDFLSRAPVAEPNPAALGPWLWVDCPKRPYSQVHDRKGPEEARFTVRGKELLEEFMSMRRKIEDANPGKAVGTITRYMREYREQLEAELLGLAAQTGLTTGKWLLFCSHDTVARTWRLIAEATAEGKLGPTSKVATVEAGQPNQVICVYTYDFADKEDVRRVLDALVELDLVGTNLKAVYYKCDAYTHMGLMSGNEYKIKPTLYDSGSMLNPEKVKGGKSKGEKAFDG